MNEVFYSSLARALDGPSLVTPHSALEMEPRADQQRARIDRRVDLVEVRAVGQIEVRDRIRVSEIGEVRHQLHPIASKTERLVAPEIDRRDRIRPVAADVFDEEHLRSGVRQGYVDQTRPCPATLDAPAVDGDANAVQELVGAEES
jgi:hypothetical protein